MAVESAPGSNQFRSGQNADSRHQPRPDVENVSPRATDESIMFLVLMLLAYIGTYLALRSLVAEAFSTYSIICATFVFSPALIFLAVRIVELATGGGSGFAGVFALAGIGLPVAILALLALFVGALVGWVRATFGISTRSPSEPDALCGQCGHSSAQHRMTAVVPPLLACSVDGCDCALTTVDLLQAKSLSR